MPLNSEHLVNALKKEIEAVELDALQALVDSNGQLFNKRIPVSVFLTSSFRISTLEHCVYLEFSLKKGYCVQVEKFIQCLAKNYFNLVQMDSCSTEYNTLTFTRFVSDYQLFIKGDGVSLMD